MSFTFKPRTPSPGGGGSNSALAKQRCIFDWWTPQKKFVKPSITEVQKYFEAKGSNPVEAFNFYVFNEKLNWCIAGVEMVTWKTSAAFWIKRDNKRKLRSL